VSVPETTVSVPKSSIGIAGVLKRPQFTLLVLGQTVSQLGDRLHNMALFALVEAAAATETTALEVSKIGVATLIPTALAPIVGALVDRWNKRMTMIACDLFRAIIVALIPWVYLTLGYIWPVYVVAFFVGLAGVFFNAAKMALIPDLVEHEDLGASQPSRASLVEACLWAGAFGTALAGKGGRPVSTSTLSRTPSPSSRWWGSWCSVTQHFGETGSIIRSPNRQTWYGRKLRTSGTTCAKRFA
jgi:MFS family permease